jgi:hypothetical protein
LIAAAPKIVLLSFLLVLPRRIALHGHGANCIKL